MSTFDVPKIRVTIWKIALVADALAVALLLASSAVLLRSGPASRGATMLLLRLGLVLAGLVAAALAVRGALEALRPERFAGPGAIPWRHRRMWGTLLAIQGLCWSLWCGYTVATSPDPSWGTYLPGLAVALTSALWLHGMRPPTYAENAS